MLDATDIQECFLSGKNLESLQELSLDKHSQGGFSKYRLNQVDQNPLIRTRGKKRKGKTSLEKQFCLLLRKLGN